MTTKLITAYLRRIARKGGMAGTGKSKARPRWQAQAAAKVRWDRYRAAKAEREA